MKKALAGALFLAFGVLAVYTWHLAAERNGALRDAREARLRADSLEVASDTTKELVDVLGDSIRIWQRRTYQLSLVRDSLDAALGQESAARADLELTLDTIQVVQEAPVEVRDSIREAHFAERRGVFAIAVDVRLMPTYGNMDLRMHQVKPLTAHLRLGCEEVEEGEEGALRRAYTNLTVDADAGVRLGIGEVVQDPTVCNPPAPPQVHFHWGTAWKVGTVTAAGTSLLLLLLGG